MLYMKKLLFVLALLTVAASGWCEDRSMAELNPGFEDALIQAMKPKNFFRRAGEGTCSHAVFIGPDDVAAGAAKIKDLATREEERISL